LRSGDILLTEGGDPDKLGRGAVWRGEIQGCIHQNHVFRVRLKNDGFVPDYVSALLGSSYGKRYFLRAAKQTTGIASINRTQLGGFPVMAAPPETQQRYAAAVFKVRELETRLLGAVRAADKLFDSLAQRAFLGEL
jgi:type I restriction enzyme S subunit